MDVIAKALGIGRTSVYRDGYAALSLGTGLTRWRSFRRKRNEIQREDGRPRPDLRRAMIRAPRVLLVWSDLFVIAGSASQLADSCNEAHLRNRRRGRARLGKHVVADFRDLTFWLLRSGVEFQAIPLTGWDLERSHIRSSRYPKMRWPLLVISPWRSRCRRPRVVRSMILACSYSATTPSICRVNLFSGLSA